MAVTIRGLDAFAGETAFAFFVVRLHEVVDRDRLFEVLQHLAPLIPDPETFLGELPDDLDEDLRIIGIPWAPPDPGHALDEQRRLIESASDVGVEAAWFFQTGTSLVSDDEPDDDDDDEDTGEWEDEVITGTRAALVLQDSDDDGDDGAAAVWSHGPPPQGISGEFPVDGYPAIVDELDWEDFGIAFKLAGVAMPGEGTVMLGFHTLWLAPYDGRYRNASVTYDRRHHAAHLWVDRFAVPCSAEEQARHLLWIVSRIHQVVPVLHARFAGATMAQKYGGLVDDASEPFVLGGNPLLGVHQVGGEAAVDAWIQTQTDWSREEVAQMLRELAIEIVTTGRGDSDHDDDDEHADEGTDAYDRGRHIASYAGELLRDRAIAGKLDARVAESLLPVLEHPEKYEHRRRSVVEILGALRARSAVPALIRILEATPIANTLDAIGKDELVAATATALGAIGDPQAIGALSSVVAAPGTHNDKPRPAAADALASCLAATPEPRDVDDAVLVQLLATIGKRNDGELNAETHFAYGRIARQLSPERRAEARRRLIEVESARDDTTAMLARQAALILATPTSPPPQDLRPLLREGLTALDYDHDSTIRNLRVVLRVAEVLPELVDPVDVVWLTRFAEPDIRARAHAILATLGHELPRAPLVDATAARELDDRELVRLIREPHVVGRAALIAEAGNRNVGAARRAMIDACHEVISRARQGSANLLDQDSRIFEVAIPILRRELDADTIALFDRMLRHSNFHVKWELLSAPPADPRLIGAMFHVLGERWGWQEKTAKAWLARFAGTDAYEVERRRSLAVEQRADDADDVEEEDDDEKRDDWEMN